MYDVYLNGNDILVVPHGNSVPSETTGSWRKKRRVARAVSAGILDDIRRRGYHRRALVKKSVAPETAKPR
jgi:hypothetical protein